MVDWEKLPKACGMRAEARLKPVQGEIEDTPAERAFVASLSGLVGTYQVCWVAILGGVNSAGGRQLEPLRPSGAARPFFNSEDQDRTRKPWLARS